jgi:hypothetical protein
MTGSGFWSGGSALVVVAGAAVLAGAASADACGRNGYVYAGEASLSRAFGIRAVVTPVMAARVRSGHVAGWVGVGGADAGPGGADEWLQVGLSAFPSQAGYNVYYEVTVAGRPAYHQLAAGVSVGEAVEVAVVELHRRPSWWQVWVDGVPRSRPIFLTGSDHRWAPIATTESWDGGTAGACTNTFLFRFGHVRVATAPGGDWHALRSSPAIGDPTLRVRRYGDSFLAAAGTAAVRRLGLAAR